MKFGMIGSPHGDSVSLMPAEVQMIAMNEDGAGLDGVLIDAATATPAASEIAIWLATGKAVAVLGMTATLAKTIESIVGSSEPVGTPLVVYRQVPGVTPAEFHGMVLGTVIPQRMVAAGDAEGTGKGAVAKESGPSVRLPLEALAAPEPGKTKLRGPTTWNAPDGAMFGADKLTRAIADSLGNMWGGCDIECNGRTEEQICKGNMDIDFYGYWADGDSTPYYILAVQQSYEFNPTHLGPSPAGTLNWDYYSRSYLMHTIEARRLSPAVISGARAENIELIKHGPTGYNLNQESFDVRFQTTLRKDGPGGSRPKALVELGSGPIANAFKGWSNKDMADPVGRMSHWQYCEKDTWDSREKPTSEFASRWWRDVYPDTFVCFFPDQSIQPFAFKTVSVFKIPCASSVDPVTEIAPPPAVTVTLAGGLDVHMVGFHCHAGCTQRTNHMYPFGVMTGWEKTIDLHRLCRP